jgi:hypothetical protein
VSPARLAARCLAELGPCPGPLAVAGPGADRVRAALAARGPIAADGDPAAAAVVVFLGAAARPAERQALLAAVAGRLVPGAAMVLLDHSQPRALWRRALALPRLVAAGLSPARARYPTARELAALGFRVEHLRLLAGERVQLVRAHRTGTTVPERTERVTRQSP